jgi:hypothetical protein
LTENNLKIIRRKTIAGVIIWEHFRMGCMKYVWKRFVIDLQSSNEDNKDRDGVDSDSIEIF